MKKIAAYAVSISLLLQCITVFPSTVYAQEAAKPEGIGEPNPASMVLSEDTQTQEAFIHWDNQSASTPLPQEAEDLPLAEEGSKTSPAPDTSASPVADNTLTTVYVSGSGRPDASGADEAHPTSDFNKALSLVSNNGVIQVTGDITVGGDIHFPNKTIYLMGDPSARHTITWEGEVHLGSWLYISNLILTFNSINKDCLFLNGKRAELTDTVILGYPNIYFGSKQGNVDTSSMIINNRKLEHNEINNIYLGGYQGGTTQSPSFEATNLTINGSIYGDHVGERAYLTLSGSSEASSIVHVYKVILGDRSTLHLRGSMSGVDELYVENSNLMLSRDANIEARYIYGSLSIAFDYEDVTERSIFKCTNLLGDVLISDALSSQGFRVEKIRSGNHLLVDLLNPSNSTIETNYAPAINHPRDIVFREGTTPDLRTGVTAWDFEDGDLTDAIGYPNTDLSSLTPGTYQLVYTVTDGDGNVVESVRTAYVIHNACPIIKGAADIELKVGEMDQFDLRSGITVTDDRDTDLALTVEGELKRPAPGTKESFVISYSATDTDGHKTKASRTITVTNFTPQWSGLTDVTIDRGAPFDSLAGVTASDYEDGIIQEIKLDREISTDVVGTHKLLYSATDSDGNTTTAERTIIVKDTEPPKPEPNPNPNPSPDPDPEPGPNPSPSPDPNPEPGPNPTPSPNPDPEPGPNPNPSPDPNPVPSPEQDPVPSPVPAPNANPMPIPPTVSTHAHAGQAASTAKQDAVSVHTAGVTLTFKNTTDPQKNACHANLLTGSDRLEHLILTPQEKASIGSSATVRVYLEAADITDTVPENEKQAVLELADGSKIARYLDLDLLRQIGTDAPYRMDKTNGAIQIVLRLPDELLAENSVERVYHMVRIQDGEAIRLDTVFHADTQELTFDTDTFSTFALIYEDTAEEPALDTAAVDAPAEDTPANAAAPAHSNLFLVILGIAVLAALIVVIAVTAKKKHSRK